MSVNSWCLSLSWFSIIRRLLQLTQEVLINNFFFNVYYYDNRMYVLHNYSYFLDIKFHLCRNSNQSCPICKYPI